MVDGALSACQVVPDFCPADGRYATDDNGNVVAIKKAAAFGETISAIVYEGRQPMQIASCVDKRLSFPSSVVLRCGSVNSADADGRHVGRWSISMPCEKKSDYCQLSAPAISQTTHLTAPGAFPGMSADSEDSRKAGHPLCIAGYTPVINGVEVGGNPQMYVHCRGDDKTAERGIYEISSSSKLGPSQQRQGDSG